MEKLTKIQVKNYVGIDISKRSLQVVKINDKNKKQWLNVKTDGAGIQRLLNCLCKNDIVALEAGCQSFWLAKKILKVVGCEVIVLNPSDLAIIYQTMKKTDKEDALKLARLIQWIPIEKLPKVSLPTEEEEKVRKLVSEPSYWSKQKVMHKNRLHSIFAREGLTQVRKKDLHTHNNRVKSIRLLQDNCCILEAERLLANLQYVDSVLQDMENQTKEVLKANTAYTKLALSMPGIGPMAAVTLFAHVGDFSRFSKAKQVSHYAGFVPRVSISGDKCHYGHIIKRGCQPMKRVMMQCAWALLRSQHGGELLVFYKNLMRRAGKKRAAVAVARKMLEILYHMFENGEFYRYMPEEKLEEKLAFYGLT